MSRKWEQSREHWERDLWERQFNLTPADITRTSDYRASGLPRNAPLPMSVSFGRLWAGTASTLLGIVGAAMFQASPVVRFGWLFGGTWVGLYLALASVRWLEK